VPAQNKTRVLVFTTVFGALWGVLEMFLGSWFHMVQFPLAGAVMAAQGAVILCVERAYTPVFGASLWTGLVALALKSVSIGAVKLGPVAGILIEAVLAEAALTALGPRRTGFFVTGLACCLEGVPHFFVTNWIFYGKGIFSAYLGLVKALESFFGLGAGLWKEILAVWVAAHILLGLASGFAAVGVAKYLRKI